MSDAWIKEAIQGATYARALTNAAGRAGRNVTPGMFDHIAQQPQAKLKPGLSQFVREPGALKPTPQQTDMQQMLAKVPWAGKDHAGSPHAESTLNAMLKRRGLDQTTPQAASRQGLIDQSFGAPTMNREHVTEVPKAMPGKSPVDQPHPSSLIEGRGVPGKLGLPAQDTRVGPAPMPQPGQPRSLPGTRMPSRPMGMVSNNTVVTHGGRVPQYQRLLNAARASAPPQVPRPVLGKNDATGVHKVASPLGIAAGVGIPLAVGGGMLLNKPGIKSNVQNMLSDKGTTQEQDLGGELHPQALAHADAIHHALTSRGLDPATLRMGIDAPPGSGKTTLARAVAAKSGMKHYGLDWEPGNWWKSTVGLGRNIEKTPRAPHAGEILEHYMLGRTYDPELFDAMVHIRRDPAVLKQQLQSRGNSAYISDMMDLDKSLGVAALGFDTLGGETVDIGDGVQLKMRPREGWGNNLDQQLMQKGINPEGLSRHEKLLSLHGGKRTGGAGWTPYVKNPFSTGETLALGASVPLGIMAARALGR